jgi:exonuclease III
MKIINWNVGRPSSAKANKILEQLNSLNGDVIILTETHSDIIPLGKYSVLSTHTLLPGFDGIQYKKGENRVSVWTKYPILKTYKTFDHFTSLCFELYTPYGIMMIYATIIGVFGGVGTRFKMDFESQILDFRKLFKSNTICLTGDFNITLQGYPYPSYAARNAFNNELKKYNLQNATYQIENNVDHIIFSEQFLADKQVAIEKWNEEKSLSDHIGIAVTLTYT